MLITFENSASGCAPSLPTVLDAGAMPAQLTNPISLPSFTAAATAACASASWLTSQRTKPPPISAATLRPTSSSRSAITTWPPLAASMRAVPSPSPDAPPVTMKTLPEMSMGCPRLLQPSAANARAVICSTLPLPSIRVQRGACASPVAAQAA